MSVLKIDGLGKAYRKYASEWRRVLSWFGFPFMPVSEQWVLADVSFVVEQGEAIGVMGQNGAGKSTLLKLLAGTQLPTSGTIDVKGRIAAILELGMGFNAEFTGRENAYHGLGLMGYGQSDIEKVMDEIEAFAEIGEYFDKPVRTYSSGMQVRVAFAVATAYRPDILIVDEALSVGDAYFQHKSFDRIKKFQELGTSLLLVSHDRNAIQAICNRAILLERGKLLKQGPPDEVSDYYNAIIADQEKRNVVQNRLKNGSAQTISGEGGAQVDKIVLRNSDGKAVEAINVGENVTIEVVVKVDQDIENLVFGYMIKDRLGIPVYGTNTFHSKQVMTQLTASDEIEYKVSFVANMGVGNYSISTALVDSEDHLSVNYEWVDLAYVFTVENRNRMPFVGGCWIEPEIKVIKS